MRAWTDRYARGLVSFYSNLCLAVEMFDVTNFGGTILCERQQECGLSLSVLLGLQEGLEYVNWHECWLLFCGEVIDGRKGDFVVSVFFFFISSDGEFLGNRMGIFVLNQLNVIKLPWDTRHARYEGKCDQTPEASQAEKSHRWKEVNCVRMRVAPRGVWKSLSQLSAQPRLFSIVVGSHNASSYTPHVSSPSLTYGQAAELSLPNSLGTFGACYFCPVPLECLSCRKRVLTHYLWTEPQAEMTLAASVWVLRGQWPFSSRTGLALVSVKQPWELSELREPSSVAFVEGLTQARPYVSAFYRESCLPKVTDSCAPHPTLL